MYNRYVLGKKCYNASQEKYPVRKDFCLLWDSHGIIFVTWWLICHSSKVNWNIKKSSSKHNVTASWFLVIFLNFNLTVRNPTFGRLIAIMACYCHYLQLSLTFPRQNNMTRRGFCVLREMGTGVVHRGKSQVRQFSQLEEKPRNCSCAHLFFTEAPIFNQLYNWCRRFCFRSPQNQ